MSKNSLLLAILTLAPAFQTAFAQETADAALEEVIVQATRRALPAEDLPSKIRLIERDAIDRQLGFSTNLTDIIGQKVPSFSPNRQKLSGAGESFRGREPLYLIDGVPQSNPIRDGSRDGCTIDAAVIERAEVVLVQHELDFSGS